MKKFTKIKTFNFFLCTLLITLISCENELLDNGNEELSQDSELVEVEYKGQIIEVEKMGKDYLFQGDILLDVSIDQNNKAVVREGELWSNATFVYEFGQMDANDEALVEKAIEHWETRTQINFIERTNQSNYVRFIDGGANACASSVGMKGGSQTIHVSSCNTVGRIVHEIGHAIGFFHEQGRSDRNQHIIVNLENTGFDSQFNIATEGVDYGPFDFNSVMMYGSFLGSNNGQPVITKLNGDTFDNPSIGLSVHDARAVEHFYNTSSPRIALRGSNGKFVSSENGANPMICDRNAPGTWERFHLVSLSNGKVALRGNNNRFVSSENGTKPMNCNRNNSSGAWEQFEFVQHDSFEISLKGSNNRYISSENGTEAMNCNRTGTGAWETFEIVRAE